MAVKLSVGRKIAYNTFIRVMEKGEAPEDVLQELYAKEEKPVTRIDKNFIKEMLFGSLRWYSKLFWILQRVSKRDLTQVTPEIRASLTLGTYQIFYMDKVPDRAAVNESVEYMKFMGQAHCVSFVNGILRSISRKTEYFAKPDKKKQPCEYLALQYAHPNWVVRLWSKRFGFEKLKTILSSNNTAPPITIRVNRKKVKEEDLSQFRNDFLKEEKVKISFSHLDYCFQLAKFPSLDKESLFGRGFYTLQDESSQLISHLVAPAKGDRVLDACAGLGGKTSHLFELSEEPISLVALDPNETRRAKAILGFERLGHKEIEYVSCDLVEYKPSALFNKILIDAPCSGLGVLRRHPEGKWQKKPDLVSNLSKKQRILLLKALELLEKGGRLVYSVCSFEPEESLSHLLYLKEEHGDKYAILSPTAFLPQYYKKYVTRDDLLLIYSGNKEEMDGFASFVIQKK